MTEGLAELGSVSRLEQGWKARRSWIWYLLGPSSLDPQCPEVKLHFPRAALTACCHGTKTHRPAVEVGWEGQEGAAFLMPFACPTLHPDPVSSLTLSPHSMHSVYMCGHLGMSCMPLGKCLSLSELRR